MASKVEQQYKMLNAELMDQVQKQRIEIGLYKKELIALKHENMELQEARIFQIARQRQDHIGILKSLMRRLEIDAESLADSTQTVEQETTSSETTLVVSSRRSQNRRSSKEICQEMRQSSALASSTRTISPSRLTHTPPPRRVAELADDSPRPISPTRRRNTIAEEPNEASELTHTPPPRRVAERANDISTEEEEEPTNTSTHKEYQQPSEKQAQRESGDLITILEDSDEETSSSYTSSPISLDSTIEEYILPRQVLRSLDPNVPAEGGGMLTRAKCKPTNSFTLDKSNTTEEQPSIQLPRLLVTQASPSLVDSLMSSLSFASEASKLSPRRSIFDGNLRKIGTNTSTPIPNKSTSPQQNTDLRKASESRNQPKVRIRKLNPKPKEAERTKLNPEPREAEQTTELSTTCFNSSGRPSRKCRPTQLLEPSLRVKMRNSSVGKKK